jgi:hypothetical protein
MSVICSTTGELINLNEIYSFLAEVVPKCGQVRDNSQFVLIILFKTTLLKTFAR